MSAMLACTTLCCLPHGGIDTSYSAAETSCLRLQTLDMVRPAFVKRYRGCSGRLQILLATNFIVSIKGVPRL